ncbi:putative teichuronic acid biosynthesis glycosyltransferase TuaH [Pelotomaculum schinkii]|uniref:Putative teichuronic acid biosynthesis glycosyltransferase TuaH n=1 Tax=Pelotomaculum schinkii TaxID=78350 RepID=A0A4Y7R5R4_9FIRM|nr:glycosyltransferase [Pelotomaculum schinkii]TEB04285.1 putative teichuronic acid biosynthesis glycosyltransferase TuaH [Pelotomaculum schinkii]
MRGETIVCLSAANWEGMWARAQQFMSIFAGQGNRVLYVDPPITYLSPLKNPELRKQPHDHVRSVDDRIRVYSPPVLLPFGNIYRVVNRFNQRILAAGLKRVCRELGWQPTIYWTYLPNTVDLPLSRDLLLVYDCADEHTAFPGLIKRETVAGMERELFGRANVTLTSAGELYQSKKDQAPDLLLAPNGADVTHFNKALQPELEIPPEIASLPRPVAGYVGAVSRWLDQELLAAAARTHPEWSLVLIGPVDTDVTILKALPNVHLLGRKSYATLPSYLKGLDLALIPFKINELTRGVNPVKLYEYLAAGKPVVSSDLPEVRPFQPAIAVYRNQPEFLKKMEEELAKDSPQKAAGRLRLAEENSWQARAAVIEEEIARKLGVERRKQGDGSFYS